MDTPLLAGYVDESNEDLNEWQNKKKSVCCCVQQIWDGAEKRQISTETICIRLAVGKF